ncbi:MAG: hypothetical protein WC796_05180 [Candidatus Pacearchaeota archaeon]|jgi:hypothetical protein
MAEDISISSIIEKVLKKTQGEGTASPTKEYEITYDSPSETLEPVYFWIVDMMNNLFGNKVEKLVDNFSATPGSGYFSEMGVKKTQMQKNVSENLGTVNTVIRSIINIIYDLKDFEIRLEHYDAAKSKDALKAESGLLALKQIWMDNVDIKRGQGSINALASGNLMFVTLRDAFMMAKSIEAAKKLDLNDRVIRILEPRLAEFLTWKELSEQELRKRYNIEKNYLKSQVNVLQLYSRWVRPYLQAAAQLEMKDQGRNPAMVTAFNTTWLELTIMGKKSVDFEDAVLSAKIPRGVKKPKREYFSVVVIDFRFRGIPQKVGQTQHWAFGGRANVKFKAYTMNDEELKLFEQQLTKSDLEEVLKYIQGTTAESLDELKKDLDHFLKTKDELKKEEEEKAKKKAQDTNPFSALFDGIFKKKDKKEEKKKEELTEKDVKKDNYIEKMLRALAADTANSFCFTVYDVYKKSHGMASHDSPFD